MHDSDFEREPDTVMTLAFNKAGFHRIDPEHTAIPVTFDREPPSGEEPPRATSVTSATCDTLQLFAGAPGRDEFDTRDVWDKEEAVFALNQALRIMVEGIATEGTQLHDEREPMLWGFANMLHRQMEILQRTVDKLVNEMKDLERDQDGSEVMALKLQTVTDRGHNLTARAEAFQHLRDIAADAYLTVTGNVWHPRRGGSRAAREGAVNAAVIDRGREAGYPAPPAQIRTCPLGHPAPPSGSAMADADGKSLIRPRVSYERPGPVFLYKDFDLVQAEAVLLRSAA